MVPYMSLCVVMIDLGNLRDQIFPRTGFAPRGGGEVGADIYQTIHNLRSNGKNPIGVKNSTHLSCLFPEIPNLVRKNPNESVERSVRWSLYVTAVLRGPVYALV
eukprot:scaffold84268_cov75-Phaeocystis_antarctica.AAC.1